MTNLYSLNNKQITERLNAVVGSWVWAYRDQDEEGVARYEAQLRGLDQALSFLGIDAGIHWVEGTPFGCTVCGETTDVYYDICDQYDREHGIEKEPEHIASDEEMEQFDADIRATFGLDE